MDVLSNNLVPTKVEPLAKMEVMVRPLLDHIDPACVAEALESVEYTPTADLQFLCSMRDDKDQPGKVRLAARHEIRQLIMDTLSLGGAFSKETARITEGSVTAEVSRYVTAGAASVTQTVLENLRAKETRENGPRTVTSSSTGSPSLGDHKTQNPPNRGGPGTSSGPDSEEVRESDQRPPGETPCLPGEDIGTATGSIPDQRSSGDSVVPLGSPPGERPSFGKAGGHVRPTRDILGGGICSVPESETHDDNA